MVATCSLQHLQCFCVDVQSRVHFFACFCGRGVLLVCLCGCNVFAAIVAMLCCRSCLSGRHVFAAMFALLLCCRVVSLLVLLGGCGACGLLCCHVSTSLVFAIVSPRAHTHILHTNMQACLLHGCGGMHGRHGAWCMHVWCVFCVHAHTVAQTQHVCSLLCFDACVFEVNGCRDLHAMLARLHEA